ncbi:unnamed protein product [Angiostrongylus costaricensis]|uniref:Peptidase C13 family protein n=1 Tax=Angiostrongylus costaricensis TaxID=334426 RepID=A0A0R3PTX5_ANGCS|nr:unnamed protein product [Angiostrongylus costaricensis]
MMYDDIAHNKLLVSRNPYPGKLFNRPHGDDLYQGLKIDYRKSSVNHENFLNILKGNATGVKGGNGRVIESNPNDRIFVYFTDHGAVGVIAFPEGMLTAKQLNTALNWMHENDRYNQLVFYLESCESGSMFEKVLKSTINEQYERVKRLTNLSHVMHFGNLLIAEEPVGWFQGQRKTHQKETTDEELHAVFSWPSRDVELMYLHQLKDEIDDIFVAKELRREIRKIHQVH